MKAPQLETSNPLVQLVSPELERDAQLGVAWLRGALGRDTLRLMGVAEHDNTPSTLEREKDRVEGFISREDQLNWMIQYDDNVVGSVWVDLRQKDTVPAPAIHIMIGEPAMRGKGVGSVSTQSVIEYLHTQGYGKIYSRHLVANFGAARLLEEQGFTDDGNSYFDHDGLSWQNMVLKAQ